MKKLGKIWSDYSFIFVLIAIFIVYAITSSGLTWSGVMNIFRHSAVIGTVALGMGLICLTGEIDLSVGSMLALTAGFSVIVFNITGSIPRLFIYSCSDLPMPENTVKKHMQIIMNRKPFALLVSFQNELALIAKL